MAEVFVFYSLFQIIIPIIGLMINALGQVISFRYASRLSLLKSLFLGFRIGIFSILILECYIFIDLQKSAIDFFCFLLIDFIIYSSFGYCYFHFIVLCTTAIRIRMLREIYEENNGLSGRELCRRYNAEKMIEIRIQRLINNGQIRYEDGKYYIGKPVMLLLGKIISTMQLIVFGKKWRNSLKRLDELKTRNI